MKKLITPLLFLGGAFVIWKYFSKGYVATKVLNIKVRGLKLNPISQAGVIVDIVNPSDQSLSFNSMSFDAIIDGYSVGSLNYLKAGTINANASTSITLPIQINPLESATFLAYLVSNKFKVKTISLKGTVNGEGFAIPIDITQSING